MRKNNKKTTPPSNDFLNYADAKTKTIKEEGMLKMGKDLNIDIYDDLFIIFFLYKCDAKQIDCITDTEFTKGLNNLNVKNFKELKSKLSKLKQQYQFDKSNYNEGKKFFTFLFTFNMDKKTKLIEFDYTQLYFTKFFPNNSKIVTLFLTFLEKEKNNCKLNKDQWVSFLDFIDTLASDFPDGYNLNDSWPLLFDEFYIDYCKKNNIEIPKQEEEMI